jgi:hypothetical protein
VFLTWKSRSKDLCKHFLTYAGLCSTVSVFCDAQYMLPIISSWYLCKPRRVFSQILCSCWYFKICFSFFKSNTNCTRYNPGSSCNSKERFGKTDTDLTVRRSSADDERIVFTAFWRRHWCRKASYRLPPNLGCQIVYSLTKNPSSGKFWRVWQWKMLEYFMDIGSILRAFDIFYDHLVYFVVIWYIIPRFGTYVAPRKIWQPCS